MEVYRTKDNQVTKYIHNDGSETAIKTVSSCNNIVGVTATARNKYSVFVSISAGCAMNCAFCYLTLKKCGYTKLTAKQIEQNVKDAITAEVAHKPELKDKYIKFSWMGMGDALPHGDIVYQVSINVLNWIFANGYAKGLDGVDLSTVYPNVKNIYFNKFIDLNSALKVYDVNPEHVDGRSPFRLFYSLHSTFQKTRNNLIPGTVPIINAVADLSTLSALAGVDIIYHQVFLHLRNDYLEEIKGLITFMTSPINHNKELRILRFNSCGGSAFKESEKFNIIVDTLSKSVNKLKYQVSTGSEIKAACGQFLLKKLKSN
jgi:adenine C2-methylase RlmN of 23S rRNA A2503 and tRNA A37